MEYAARVALGVAGGYFLGRTKKMKLALMLASTAAGRKAGGPAALLGQGKNSWTRRRNSRAWSTRCAVVSCSQERVSRSPLPHVRSSR